MFTLLPTICLCPPADNVEINAGDSYFMLAPSLGGSKKYSSKMSSLNLKNRRFYWEGSLLLPESKPLNISSSLRCYQKPPFLSQEDLNKTFFYQNDDVFPVESSTLLSNWQIKAPLPTTRNWQSAQEYFHLAIRQIDYRFLSHFIQDLLIIMIAREKINTWLSHFCPEDCG